MSDLIIVVGYRIKFEAVEAAGAIFGNYVDQDTGIEPHPTLSPDGGGSVIYIDEPNACPVADAPANVPLPDLHAAAAAATKAIEEMENYRGWEYGVIIFESNGTIGYTPLFTQENPDYVQWNPGLADVPSGARVLALLHSHPDQTDIDDTTPTGDDWIAYDEFRALSGSTREITVDPNMLNYIATSPYSSLKTYVYDKNHRNTRQTGCRLQ